MRKILCAVLAVLCAGCSQDYPDRHLSRCLMEWNAAPENIKGNWLGGQAIFIRECMSAADFASKEAQPGRYCSNKDYATFYAGCYVDRQSWSYRIKQLFQKSL